MKIGIGKIGFVIDETNLTKTQGGMIEPVNLYKILSKEHDVYFVSKLGRNSKMKQYDDSIGPLDFIFIFNGCMSKYNVINPEGKQALNMFKKYTWPVINFLNKHSNIPWCYLYDDKRYDINIPSELTHYPYKIIAGFNDSSYKYDHDSKSGIEYGHFDKIFCYERNKNNFNHKKSIQFGSMINDTSSYRTKNLIKFLNYLDSKKWQIDVKGNFKKQPKNWTGLLQEGNTFEWLKYVKYTLNINVDSRAFSRKFWEFALNDVIVFLFDYDNQYNQIPKDSYLRVSTPEELHLKMQELENNNEKYNEVLNYQRSLIKDEYLDGSFILNYFNKLIENKLGYFNKNKQQKLTFF